MKGPHDIQKSKIDHLPNDIPIEVLSWQKTKGVVLVGIWALESLRVPHKPG